MDLPTDLLSSCHLVLATAAFESGMSAVEELRLLKAQVQDVARVCNAVARSDLSKDHRASSGCHHGLTQGRYQHNVCTGR
ncbi:hypothetical protein PISMIDRAFT_686167 [Pisolithus microcarpus 441]|uniref:Unplaced genomic scaffold scaffold_167, whole genome shotgun sequence n=1 Tax=Pisolithus microcarpus 441 TaxID=765257 RepID=A0A0C9XW14_9AGAM|nr:hypothetical protein BKA83DRAFT_686167 [Pisolithus microcarpus]KIK16615.1 hypothetical protein PISMIDRAFT_686167 [Pisolithus microcarpus 441]